MMAALFRSRHPVVLAAVCLGALLGAWGTWRWAKQRLPGIMRTRISAALDRDVTVASVDPWFTSLTVEGIQIARTREPASGTQVSAKQLVIRFWLPSLIRHFRNPARAIKKVELIDPYIEVPLEPLTAALGRPVAGNRKAHEGGLPSMAAVPRTFFRIKNGTVVLTRRGKPVAEVRRLGTELDLRELPSIRGNLKLVLAPESEVALSGRVNLSLRDFEGQMALDRFD